MGEFDIKALTWDQDPTRVERARIVHDAIADRVDVQGRVVLDFGCGTGLLGFNFAPQAAGLVFADASAGMLAQVEAKAKAAGLANYRTILGEGVPEPGDWQVVVSLLALHHIVDWQAAVSALAASLPSGGFLALSDLCTEDGSFHGGIPVPHLGFDPEVLAGFIELQGLEILKAETVHTIVRPGLEDSRGYPLFLVLACQP